MTICIKPHQHRQRRGFTLIELLMVVSIIGLLLGIATRNHRASLDRGRDAAVLVSLQELRTAVYRYALDHNGSFPGELKALEGTYVKRLPSEWRGGAATGRFGYEAERGIVTLFDAEGSGPSTARDLHGQEYGKY